MDDVVWFHVADAFKSRLERVWSLSGVTKQEWFESGLAYSDEKLAQSPNQRTSLESRANCPAEKRGFHNGQQQDKAVGSQCAGVEFGKISSFGLSVDCHGET